MSKPFLRFEDGRVRLGGKNLLVQSASLSIRPSISPERVYGDYDASIAGAKTEFVNFAPQDGLKGNLDVDFIINADMFSVNSVDRMFDIRDGMDEKPVDGNVVGRYLFNNMYLTSFSFSMTPYGVISAKATYDIYGTIRKTADRRFTKSSIDPAHALKSFGKITASGVDVDAANDNKPFEVKALTYNISVGRNVSSRIRGNEHTSVGTLPDGTLPYRVSTENIEAEMKIEANEIIQKLNPYGDYQSSGTSKGLSDSKIQAFLYSMGGDRIAKFACQGKIVDESYSISEGQYANGSITVRQIIK